MRWHLTILVLLIMDPAVRLSEGTCVLDSDFGFALNCRFKKSGLFRVRNLGGVKGYVGLGFSVGDELRFPDSLSNTDTSKRRSVAAARSANIASISSNQRVDAAHPAPVLRQGVTVPPFKPIPPSSGAPSGGSRYQHLLVGPVSAAHNISSGHSGMHAVAAPALAALGVPPFQALPPSITRVPNGPAQAQMVGVQIIKAPAVFRESLQAATNHFQVRKDINPVVDPGLSTNTLSLRTLPGAPIDTPAQKNSLLSTSSLSKLENKPLSTVLMNHSIKMLAKASNLSEEAITAAIAIRQQQLLLQQQRQELALAAATTTTTTTRRPATAANVINKYPMADVSKVMNAPKEYYPLGYDKNFDDKFASRVSLPDTSFYCGDQKHFPGLYADEDLGCMVFHVCAFTDDGLIMKSFLCPESTLFDQTILKCNWWFYVDCKASRKLYDSNLPISKSYQLMKALAFFSSYNKS